MALISCRECGREISDAAETCTHCGCPIAERPNAPRDGVRVPGWVKGGVLAALLLWFLFPIPASRIAPPRDERTDRASDAAPAQNGRCQSSDISVGKLNGRVEGRYIYIAGRQVNHCTHPTGAQIKVTIYDEDRNILTVHDSWPASINNIPDGSDFPFEDMIDTGGFSSFDVRVVSTQTWDDHR